jgi:hypothetical protein
VYRPGRDDNRPRTKRLSKIKMIIGIRTKRLGESVMIIMLRTEFLGHSFRTCEVMGSL